jgi:hypothetical protein
VDELFRLPFLWVSWNWSREDFGRSWGATWCSLTNFISLKRLSMKNVTWHFGGMGDNEALLSQDAIIMKVRRTPSIRRLRSDLSRKSMLPCFRKSGQK